jgi:hypothetical protein
MKTVKISSVVGSRHLAGNDMGTRDLPKLLAAVLVADDEELLILDFTGTDATASYLSQSVIKLVRMANAGELNRFFVFAGLNDHTRDDLQIVLSLQKMAAFVVDSVEALNKNRGAEVLGYLEPLYKDTLERVVRSPGTTAEELMSKAKKEKIQKTGWLNRLAFLAGQRLIRRHKRAREFVFKPIWEDQ